MREAQILEQQLEDLGAMRHWNPQLQKLDPYLQLVRISENATVPGLKAGFWQILRVKEGVPVVPIMVLEGDEGEFREPGEWMLTKVQSWDLSDDRVIRDRARRDAQIARDKAHERAEMRGEIGEEIMGLMKGRNNPGVNFGAKKWSRDPKARKK